MPICHGRLTADDGKHGGAGAPGPDDRDSGRPGAARGAVRHRAPRGADLHALRGRGARARDHVPVPVRRVQPEAVRRRGPVRLRSRSGPALAQAHLPHRRAGDAAPVAGAEPAVGHRRGPAPVPAELPAARQPLPGRGAPGAAAVRRGGAAPLHVPRAPGGHGHRGRRRDGRVREGRARGHAPRAGRRDRPARPGLRHRRAPVPVHRGRDRAPGGEVRRGVAVRRAAAGAGHPAVLRLAGTGRGHRRGVARSGPSTRSWSRARARAGTGRTRTSASSSRSSTSICSSARPTRPSTRSGR